MCCNRHDGGCRAYFDVSGALRRAADSRVERLNPHRGPRPRLAFSASDRPLRPHREVRHHLLLLVLGQILHERLKRFLELWVLFEFFQNATADAFRAFLLLHVLQHDGPRHAFR
jgi:hypothetical protein